MVGALMQILITRTEFFIMGMLFMLFYQLLVILPKIKNSNDYKKMVKDFSLDNRIISAATYLMVFVSYAVDSLPFILAFIYPAAGFALYCCFFLRIFLKEPTRRKENCIDLTMRYMPLFAYLYLYFF